MREFAKYLVEVVSQQEQQASLPRAALNGRKLTVLCVGRVPLPLPRANNELMFIPTGEVAKAAFRAASVAWLTSSEVKKIADAG